MTVLWIVCGVLTGVLFLLARRLHQARDRVGHLQARLASVLGRDSTGVSIWGPDGRLVACNERFREFYPDVPIKRGLELEDLVRFTATRGLVQVPEEELESWVAACLSGRQESRRDVVRAADGRWLALDIGPTDRGETLMLYTDVTDGHDAEVVGTELTAQLAARTAEVHLLLHLVDAISNQDSFDTAAGRLVALVCEWAEWPVGHVYRIDSNTSLASPIRATVHASEAFDTLRTALQSEEPHPAADLAERVFRSGRVVWVANLGSDPTFSDERRAVMKGIRGACGVPITRDERVVGVIEFLSPAPLVPSPSRTAVLKAAGAILGSV